MNATLLHPGPPHVSEGRAIVVAVLVVGVMVVASSVAGGSVVKEIVVGFVGSVTWSWLKTSAQIERSHVIMNTVHLCIDVTA